MNEKEKNSESSYKEEVNAPDSSQMDLNFKKEEKKKIILIDLKQL